jgi:O-antigen ligase
MREIFFPRDCPGNKLSYFHLMAFLIALPFDRFFSELILISLLAHTCIQYSYKRRQPVNPYLFLPALPFALTLACTFYSNHTEMALKEMERQLALILFPLIFTALTISIEKYRMRLLTIFGFTCILLIIYLYFDALAVIRFNKLPLSALFKNGFTNHNFVEPISLHATYFSVFLSLSLAVYLYQMIFSKGMIVKFLYASGCLVLITGMLQLSARAPIIATLLIVLLLFPLLLLKGHTRRKFVTISCSFSILVFICAFSMKSFRTRFIQDAKDDMAMHTPDSQVLIESRMIRWRSAWELIRRSPLIGYGSGSEISLLKDKYFENHLYNSYLNELNAHNQYLSFLLKSGIIGLSVYLYLLYMGFRIAIREKDFFLCSFLVIISLVSFTENILDVNKGIFFYSFFFTLLLSRPISQPGYSNKRILSSSLTVGPFKNSAVIA